ncbi:hypothetical protein [Labrenzia sp. PHM005]|uniref:hypothetical protein n=1 Tax=Labrenzia sp. PHM005 TaxID=2590016 RepID=UPI0011403EC5|nr:hypothetical protein [Labrenzia sp. PHM005]QDG78779.1 hypothetical protein FJ695_24545 [Labrenzia sp. PHM005]
MTTRYMSEDDNSDQNDDQLPEEPRIFLNNNGRYRGNLLLLSGLGLLLIATGMVLSSILS